MLKNIIHLLCIIFITLCVCDTKSKTIYTPPKVVLITIDGVMWETIFDVHAGVGNLKPTSRELVPNIYSHFVDNGVSIGKSSPAFTKNLAHVSQPGYLEIISGFPSSSCFDNYCTQNTNPTIINQFPNNSAVFSGWDTIAKTFDNSLAIVNIGKNIRNKQWQELHLPNDIIYSDEFGDEEYRSDEHTQNAVIRFLKIRQPNFLWVSYGDTDEWAHQNNTLQYWISLTTIDHYINEIMKLTDPNTVFIITTDHGRDKDNWQHHGGSVSSGRVWIMISGSNIPKVGFVKYNREVYLSDIFPTIMAVSKGIYSDKSLLNYN